MDRDALLIGPDRVVVPGEAAVVRMAPRHDAEAAMMASSIGFASP